jgi:hypothetical protein
MSDTRTELDVARAMRAVELPSPQKCGDNLWLFALRITGTGEAFRRQLGETVFRMPEAFLNDDFLERCQGLPVVVEHPKARVLNSEEFARRVVGAIMLPYIRNDEVWGVARIYDGEAAYAMQNLALSTSPAVVIKKSESRATELKDGRKLLIEGEPYLLDHLAIVAQGVWDKGCHPSGIRNDNMTDEENKRVESADQGRELLTKIDGALTKFGDMADALGHRMEKIDQRLDALENGRDDRRARRDDDDPESRERRVPGEPRPVVADSTEERDPGYHNRMTEAQAKADGAFACWGERAPKYLTGERLSAYRRRLLAPHKKHSERYRGAALETITDGVILEQVEDQIFADSMAAATNPEAIGPGRLRMVSKRDEAGHTINRFFGDPATWMSAFTGNRRYVTKIATPGDFRR